MKIKKYVSLFLFCFFILGCQHTQKFCTRINWYELGRQDGTQGKNKKSALQKRRMEICHIKDETSVKTYQAGFDQGLGNYCTFKTGYNYGYANITKTNDVCPSVLKDLFIKGYQAGKQFNKDQVSTSKQK